MSKRPALGPTVTTFTAVLLIAGIAIAGRNSDKQKRASDAGSHKVGEAKFRASAPAQTATKYYHFAYAATESEQALRLAQQSDAIFERVHAIVGAPLGESIDVDAFGSVRNTAGAAFFGRVRMVLDDRAEVVLAHETSHVVAQRLAGAERDQHWRRALVLNEGLATYVEQHFEADATSEVEAAASLANDRLLLAALYLRHELLVPEISDYALLAAMRGEDLKYPIGAAVIRAMVALYGPESISRLVRAFADETLPADLSGLTLMDATFQLAHMDFGAVVAQLFKQAASDAQLHASELAALPRPRVRLVRRGTAFGAQTLCDTDQANARAFHLRFKPRHDSSFERYDAVVVTGDKPAWRPASKIQQGEICVQVGVALASDRVLFEPWTCLSTSDASSWDGPADEDAKSDESE